MSHPVLDLFHPLIRRWFREKVGSPTDIQIQAWPCIARGEHLLVTAPTGSGKTMTAFLWALQKLITGEWPPGRVRVLYVSPLKALNNDVQRNLLKPLRELRDCFLAAGEPFPSIRVLTRSGDTPPSDRRQMLRTPPEILITTPESLNLLLSSKNNRTILSGVETVILDEIHAVLDNKRGTHLITAVDRIIPLAGELQRIALSATVQPLEPVAGFVGGFTMSGSGGEYRYQKRPVTILKSAAKKQYELAVEAIEQDYERGEQDALWQSLAVNLLKIIAENTATLVFCNNRRAVEKMTRFINDAAGETLVYSHHGSLARELRLAVEEKLKNGELKGIVATNSLELGIDIGELDAVVLVQTPPSLTATIQRVGRAGHAVGRVSKGILFPMFGLDLVEAAVASLNLPALAIEPVAPVEAPLDVLAQVLLSMTAVETWHLDELYAFLKASYPYRNLSRKSYDLLLEMLAGRYGDTRLRELKPRIVLDRLDRTVKARDGAERLVYLAGGTIPDRGYYDLRLVDTRAKIGELDEEFVWERSVGETFMLGSRVWRIMRVTHNDVEVAPGGRTINIIPFWRAEEQNRDFFHSEKIGLFLEEADQNPDPASLASKLAAGYGWSGQAAGQLVRFLQWQKEATGKPLPHRRHILVEHCSDPLNSADSKQVILHTLWGGKVNRPFAMALAAAWERQFGYPLEMHVNNNSIMVMLPHSFAPADLFSLVSSENLEKLLQGRLASSGFFGARFRENAGRALLLPRAGFKKRMPLWLNRLRARKLLAAVTPHKDFPIILETWRACLKDEFDLDTVKQLLDEISDGRIEISETVTHRPSPFASGLVWRQVNQYMYEDDTPAGGKEPGLSGELLKELVFSPHLRPELPEALIRELDGKLKRTAPGYAPADGEELLLWIKERLFIPADEGDALFAAMERDHRVNAEEVKGELGGKAAWLHLPGAEQPGLCALEVLPRLAAGLGVSPANLELRPLTPRAAGALAAGLQKARDLFAAGDAPEPEEINCDTALLAGQWLSYYGPVPREFAAGRIGLPVEQWEVVLSTLVKEESVVVDLLTPGAGREELCDCENLERLFAMARRARRPEFKPLPVTALPLFLASWQGVVEKGESLEGLQERLERLFGYVSQARLWEEAILPARMDPYFTTWLDSLLQTSDLLWFGRGGKRVSFCFQGDLELFPRGDGDRKEDGPEEARALFPDPWGKYDLLALGRHTGLSSEDLTRRVWRHLWQGELANDNLAVLRRGILNKFTPVRVEERKASSRRGGYGRWSASRPLHGSWFLLPENEERDPVEQEELVKERIRQLFCRYGLLCRELLQQELPALQWRRIFRTLRLMEFSGEIYAGHFFEQITGLQFISREAYRFLGRGLVEDSIYWINAADPASLCGFKIPGLDEDLPARLPTSYMVFHGAALKVVARRNGKELTIKTGPDDPHLPAYFAFFKTLLSREFNPLKCVVVESINGLPALQSPYREALSQVGFTGQYKFLELRRQYG